MGFRFQLHFFFITLCLLKYVKTQEQFYNSSSSSSTDESSGSSSDGKKVQRSSCNVFQGSWVVDSSYPLYDYSNCPFIDPEFNCKKYGRPDNLYLRYRWKPASCDIPRFNGLDFLRRWRGKKIMFVGDSLSLNQWQSLTCLIHASLPNLKTTVVRKDSISSVTFQVSSTLTYLSLLHTNHCLMQCMFCLLASVSFFGSTKNCLFSFYLAVN
ncbi:hypothetical protein MKW94_018638 [Papaver nudicaule]|uniref:Trichome birefringence-like N-terminal domain-containing protein n=1 Tax=Papaver nudicaule TaxID=74823 RepID=A0AA41RTC0_PAPNU|nr:hypothetical protein [Papaver nudicaule]